MRVILFGLTGFGNSALRGLRKAGAQVVAVLTRGEAGSFPYYPERPLAEEAAALGIPIYLDLPLNTLETAERVKAWEPDLLVVATYHERVPTRLLRLPHLGALHVHPSLLPAYQGETPTTWALINGEKETGVTLQALTSHLTFAGPILSQARCPIDPAETDGTLRQKLARLSEGLLAELVAKVRSGVPLQGASPDPAKITVYPKRTRKDGFIKMDEPTRQILARIRGVTPYPGAWTTVDGQEVQLLQARPYPEPASEVAPGLLLRVEDGWAEVQTADGILCLRTAPPLRLPADGRPLLLGQEPPRFLAIKKEQKVQLLVHTREQYGIEPGAEEFPLMVVVAVAYPCNAKCPHCPYTEGNSDIRQKYADTPFMDPGLFQKIARECGEYGAFIRVTGGGEPLLHPADMVGQIEYAKGVGARVWLNTNGSNLDQRAAERLLACGCDMVEFSVDAGDPDVYAVVRKGLDWETLLRNVRYMVERRNATKAPTRIVASMVIQDLIRDRVEAYTQFWMGLGIDEVIRRKFLTWGSNTALDPSRSADPDPYLDKTVGEPCPFPFHRLNIDSRGKVEVCGYDIMGRTNFGSVREQRIRDIWKGPQFTWWRQMHAERRGGEIPLCRECPDWQYRSWTHNWTKVIRTAEGRRQVAIEATEA